MDWSDLQGAICEFVVILHGQLVWCTDSLCPECAPKVLEMIRAKLTNTESGRQLLALLVIEDSKWGDLLRSKGFDL